MLTKYGYPTRSMSQQLRDELHDSLARALEVGRVYETTNNQVFYVLRVDHGSEPGEFPSGRRPAQAKVVFLSGPGTGWREGVPTWIQGLNLEWMTPVRIT